MFNSPFEFFSVVLHGFTPQEAMRKINLAHLRIYEAEARKLRESLGLGPTDPIPEE